MTNQNHHRIQLSILIALMITAVVLLAGGFSGLRLKSGEPIHLLDWILAQLASQNLGELPEYEIETGGSGIWYQLNSTLRGSIIVIFWLILSFSLIYAIISPEFRRELVRVFFLLLTLAVLLPYIARRITEQVNPTEGEMTSGEVPIEGAQFPEPPLFVQQPPEWIFWVAKAVLILLLFTGIYMLWRYLRPKPDPQAVVARHVKKALSELESGNVLELSLIHI